MRTSLTRITEAGHLRWIKEHITAEGGSMRWVTRTYWSRTRRSAEWWARFARERHGKDVTPDHEPGLARVEEQAVAEESVFVDESAVIDEPAVGAELPAAGPDEPEPEPVPVPEAEPVSAGYRVLVGVCAADARMALTEGDCRSLTPLAEQWLFRGASPKDVTRALTEGLPPTVSNPGGFARRRLETKMPPQKREPRAKVTRVIMACATCDQDERTVTIDRGRVSAAVVASVTVTVTRGTFRVTGPRLGKSPPARAPGSLTMREPGGFFRTLDRLSRPQRTHMCADCGK